MDQLNQAIVEQAPVSDLPEFNSFLASSLQKRLDGNRHYTKEEIQRISLLERKLVPAEFPLASQTSENLRALALLSRCRLENASQISSHRAVIGRVIVAFKRLLWRFIYPPLEKAFDAQQEFSSWMVYSHAELLTKVNELELELSQLKNCKSE
jgi:hypothetical protein